LTKVIYLEKIALQDIKTEKFEANFIAHFKYCFLFNLSLIITILTGGFSSSMIHNLAFLNQINKFYLSLFSKEQSHY